VKYLSRAAHENIVKLFGTMENTDSKTMIVMEFADCGTLYNYLHQEGEEKRNYTYLAALNWMLQLARVSLTQAFFFSGYYDRYSNILGT